MKTTSLISLARLLLFIFAVNFFSSLALAIDEPIERRTLTLVDPMKYPAGICPGNPLTTPARPPLPLGTSQPTDQIRRDRDDFAGLSAARMIYHLSDLEVNSSGKAYVENLRSFLNEIPQDYQLYFILSDANVGLKYMILRPTTALKPWILGIAGTETILDWIMDLDLGHSQFSKMQKILSLFTTCQYLDEGFPIVGAQWVIAGHSLGGGLAQALAYEIQNRRLKANLRPIDLRLVTFNAFGARQLIEKSAAYDARVMPYVRATNYFVLGDEVSRIGEHVGPTLQLTPPGESPNTHPRLRSPSEIARRHGIEMVYELASHGRGLMSGLSFATVQATPERKVLRSLLPTAKVLSRLAMAAYDEGNPERILERIAANVESVEHLSRTDASNRRILQYTRALIYSQIDVWSATEGGPLAKSARVAELRRLLKRLQ